MLSVHIAGKSDREKQRVNKLTSLCKWFAEWEMSKKDKRKGICREPWNIKLRVYVGMGGREDENISFIQMM